MTEASDRIESLSLDQLDNELADGDVILLDVREPDEYRLDSIPGALSAPKGMLEFYADPTSSFQRVVLYCGSGGRSAFAASALLSMGYARVRIFEADSKRGRLVCQLEAQPHNASNASPL